MTVLERFLVAIPGIDPTGVNATQLHAMASSWLGHGGTPTWSVAPPRIVDGVPALEFATFGGDAAERLGEAAVPGREVRLGASRGEVLLPPARIACLSWADLCRPSSWRRWDVEFLTPTSYRRGDHFAPWPEPTALLHSLSERWAGPGVPRISQERAPEVRVEAVEGQTRRLRLTVGRERRAITIHGFVGQIRYYCGDAEVAAQVNRLLMFAEFAGAGVYATWGLGVMRFRPAGEPENTDVESGYRARQRHVSSV